MIDRDLGESSDAQFEAPAPGNARPRRLSTTFVRIGAVAVLACVPLAACGDDGGAGGGAAAEDGGGVASVEDFCASMDRVNVHLDSRGFFESAEDDEVAPALEAVRSIDVPEEITSQWATVIKGTEKAVELENSGGRFEKTAESEKAADRILSYVDVQCSVDLSS
ncbi:hypothetical protein [Actinomadura sp. 3N407]|uniref:hypothetical protein n=1 Tax=Actinomadura sp. 3N407 TaxID=3457423 RepID=UPI003FCEB64A